MGHGLYGSAWGQALSSGGSDLAAWGTTAWAGWGTGESSLLLIGAQGVTGILFPP